MTWRGTSSSRTSATSSACAVQHETDHLEGKLFIDYLEPLVLRSAEEKIREFERVYLQGQREGTIPPDDELVRRLAGMTHPPAVADAASVIAAGDGE